jgi:hypothetical protein
MLRVQRATQYEMWRGTPMNNMYFRNLGLYISYIYIYIYIERERERERIVRQLWWTNLEFSPVCVIPPWFCMLIYHLGDEQ